MGYGEMIGAGIQATASHINQGAAEWHAARQRREAERMMAMQRDLLRKQVMWQKMIQSGMAERERFQRDVGLVERERGRKGQEQAKSYQMSRQKFNDMLGMINRSPQLRTQAVANLTALQGRGF